VQTCFLSDVIT